MDEFSTSEAEEIDVENPAVKDQFSGLAHEERNDVNLSMNGRRIKEEKDQKVEGKSESLNSLAWNWETQFLRSCLLTAWTAFRPITTLCYVFSE